jgi:putative transposase
MPTDLTDPARYAGYRFPTAVIHHALWLLNRFTLSLRTVQEMLLERGVTLSHETLREWNQKFARQIALEIKRRRDAPGKTWHLDEMHVIVRGKVMWLWRAVDEHGIVLDILLHDHRDTEAAKHFFETILENLEFKPKRIVTDQLGSYKAAWNELPALEAVKQVFVKSEARLNNRIERDHEHVREKQRVSRGWRSLPEQLERVLRCRDFVRNVFKKKRGTAGEARVGWQIAFQIWGEVVASVSPS